MRKPSLIVFLLFFLVCQSVTPIIYAEVDGDPVFSDSPLLIGPANSDRSYVFALVDIDGDTDRDLIMQSRGGDGNYILSSYLNDGNGSYSAGQQIGSSFASLVFQIASGDIDGDGDPDLVTANGYYFNNGSGNFSHTPLAAGVGLSKAFALGDIDDDGDLDLVYGSSIVTFLLNSGSGEYNFGSTFRRSINDTNSVQAINLVDLNDDSKLDLLLTLIDQNQPNEIRLYLNLGAGDFGQQSSSDDGYGILGSVVGVASRIRQITFGDVDGDGDLDVVSANEEQNRLYLNNGTGVFDINGQAVGSQSDFTDQIALGDVDGDGDLDAIAASRIGDNRLYLNDGGGVFSSEEPVLGLGRASYTVALADVDGDGDLDYFLGNHLQANQISFNLGTGADNDADSILDGDDNCLTIANADQLDFDSDGTGNRCDEDDDGDGMPDVFEISNGLNPLDANDANDDLDRDGDSNLSEFLNGTDFKLPFISVGIDVGLGVDNTLIVALGDLDGDADLDLIAINEDQNKLYLNDGGGGFNAIGQPFGSASAVNLDAVLGDVDGDGDLDLFIGNRQGADEVYFNNGKADFGVGVADGGAFQTTSQVLLRDFDADGDLDVFAAISVTSNVTGLQPKRNNGRGEFSNYLGHVVTKTSAIGDVNGDGFEDLIISRSGDFSVFLGMEFVGGTFPFDLNVIQNISLTEDGMFNFPSKLVLGDFDADGDQDLLIGFTDLPAKLFLNNGSGIFPAFGLTVGSGSSNNIVIGDIDSDGDLDFITSGVGGNLVYLNDGSANFDIGRPLGSDSDNTIAVVLGDVDGDGDLDVVTANDGQTNKVYINSCICSPPVDTDRDGITDNVDLDDDNDGLSDSNEALIGFLNPLNSDDANADEDGDGFSNRIEFFSNTELDNAASKPDGSSFSYHSLSSRYSFLKQLGQTQASLLTQDLSCLIDVEFYVDANNGDFVFGPSRAESCANRQYNGNPASVISSVANFTREDECANYPCSNSVVQSDNIYRFSVNNQLLVATADDNFFISTHSEENNDTDYRYDFSLASKKPVSFSANDLNGTYYIASIGQGIYQPGNAEFSQLEQMALSFDGAGNCSVVSTESLSVVRQGYLDAAIDRFTLTVSNQARPTVLCEYTAMADGTVTVNVGDERFALKTQFNMAENAMVGNFSEAKLNDNSYLAGIAESSAVIGAVLALDFSTLQGNNGIISGAYLVNGHFSFLGDDDLGPAVNSADYEGNYRSIISFDNTTADAVGYSPCDLESASSAFGRTQVITNTSPVNISALHGERKIYGCRYRVLNQGRIEVETTSLNALGGEEVQSIIYYLSLDHNMLLRADQTIDSSLAYTTRLAMAVKYTGANVELIRDEFLNGVGPLADTGNVFVDSDNDGLADAWETFYGFNPSLAGEQDLDTDNDGLSNLQEQSNGTHPRLADTDSDGMPDGFEVTFTLDPLDPSDASGDADSDGLNNLLEFGLNTNPQVADGDNIADVVFADANLEACVSSTAQNLGITKIVELSGLNCNFQSVADLSGLGRLQQLQIVNLSFNNISDLGPVQFLRQLSSLSIIDNSISDLSALIGLNLTRLEVADNPINDFAVIYGLSRLVTLDVRRLNVDLVEIAKLNSLTALSIDGIVDSGEAVDLTPLLSLDITSFNACDLGFSDLSFVSAWPDLQSLSVCDNRITDISILATLNDLRFLNLDRNHITDISPLASLGLAGDLRIQGNVISDLSPLQNQVNLTRLFADNNAIVDVTPLAGLTNLTELVIDGNRIQDVTPLTSLLTGGTLTQLSVSKNGISDTNWLIGSSLQFLDIDENPLDAAGIAFVQGLGINSNLPQVVDLPTINQITLSTTSVNLDGGAQTIDVAVDLSATNGNNIQFYCFSLDGPSSVGLLFYCSAPGDNGVHSLTVPAQATRGEWTLRVNGLSDQGAWSLRSPTLFGLGFDQFVSVNGTGLGDFKAPRLSDFQLGNPVVVAGGSLTVNASGTDVDSGLVEIEVNYSGALPDNIINSAITIDLATNTGSVPIALSDPAGEWQVTFIKLLDAAANYTFINASDLNRDGKNTSFDVVNGNDDSDADGIPDVIENSFSFLDAADPSDAQADQDNDGFSNVLEFFSNTNLNDANSAPNGIPYVINNFNSEYQFDQIAGFEPASAFTQDSHCVDSTDLYIENATGDFIAGPIYVESCISREFNGFPAASLSSSDSSNSELECDQFPCTNPHTLTDNIYQSTEDGGIFVATADNSLFVIGRAEEEPGGIEYDFTLVSQKPLNYSSTDLVGTYYLPSVSKDFNQTDNSELASLEEFTLTFDGSGGCTAAADIDIRQTQQGTGDALANRFVTNQVFALLDFESCSYTAEPNGKVSVNVEITTPAGSQTLSFVTQMAANDMLGVNSQIDNSRAFKGIGAAMRLDINTVEGDNSILAGDFLVTGYFGSLGNTQADFGFSASDSDGINREVIGFNPNDTDADGYSNCSFESSFSAFGRHHFLSGGTFPVNLSFLVAQRSPQQSCRYKVLAAGQLEVQLLERGEDDFAEANVRRYRISQDHKVLMRADQVATNNEQGALLSTITGLAVGIQYTGTNIEFLIDDFLNGVGPLDNDNDGLRNEVDDDDDGDGIPDVDDPEPYFAGSSVDTDGDGIVDAIDTDDDNDGIPDVDEALYDFLNPLDFTDASADEDGDGISNLIEFLRGTLLDDANSSPGTAYQLSSFFSSYDYNYVSDFAPSSSFIQDSNCIADLDVYIDDNTGDFVLGPVYGELCNTRNLTINTGEVTTQDTADFEPECDSYPCTIGFLREDNILRDEEDQEILVVTEDFSFMVGNDVEVEADRYSYNMSILSENPLNYSDADLTGTYYLPGFTKGFSQSSGAEFARFDEVTLSFDGAGSCTAVGNVLRLNAEQGAADAQANRAVLTQSVFSGAVSNCSYNTEAGGALSIELEVDTGAGTIPFFIQQMISANDMLGAITNAVDFNSEQIGSNEVSMAAMVRIDVTTVEGDNSLLDGSYLINGHFSAFSTIDSANGLITVDSDGNARSVLTFDASSTDAEGYSGCSSDRAISSFGRGELAVAPVGLQQLSLLNGSRSQPQCRYKVLTNGQVEIESTTDINANDENTVTRLFHLSSDHNVLMNAGQLRVESDQSAISSLVTELSIGIKYTGADIEDIRDEFILGVGPLDRDGNGLPDVADVEPPVITAPDSIFVSASTTTASGLPATTESIATFLNDASATDNFDGVITNIINDAPATFPLGTTTVTFSATDAAGNTGTAQAIVTVADLQSPIITLIGNSEISLFVGDSYADLGVSASDNVDGDITANVQVSGNVDVNTAGIYTLTYTVSDAANNSAAPVTRTVTVAADNTTPVVTAPADIALETSNSNGVAANNAAISTFLLEASATDVIDGVVTVSNDAPTNFALGVTNVTFSADDKAGNTGTAQASVSITILCSAGSYRQAQTFDTCLVAPPGSFVDAPGATEPELCAVGTFQSQTGQSSCASAPINTFVDSLGATEATACPVGFVQPLTGQSSCVVDGSPKQQVMGINASVSVVPGGDFTTTAVYSVSDSDASLSGLGLRIHFDSSKLSWNEFKNVLTTSKIAQDEQPVPDLEDFDNDASTDRYLTVAWASLATDWPGSQPINLFEINFTANAGFTQGSVTRLGFSAIDTAAGYQFVGTAIEVASGVSLDIDDNGQAAALTDGLMVIRYLFGFSESVIGNGAVDTVGCNRCEAGDIVNHLQQLEASLDVDGDGEARALTDGLLVLKQLFGFTGATLIDGTVDPNCSRCSADEIDQYIDQLLP